MTELKYGGGDVKIMYGSQEIGGATKLEPGTILYLTEDLKAERSFEGVHLKSTTKDWSNIDGIHFEAYYNNSKKVTDGRIYSDDFKSLDKGKKYGIDTSSYSITLSRSIIDGEYRLNASADIWNLIFVVSAL